MSATPTRQQARWDADRALRRFTPIDDLPAGAVFTGAEIRHGAAECPRCGVLVEARRTGRAHTATDATCKLRRALADLLAEHLVSASCVPSVQLLDSAA
jgi:hypothetical protein